MNACMENAGWGGFDDRNSKAKANGKIRGSGLSTYIEACAFAGSEPAFLELKSDGCVDLRIGTQSNGQGHATAYAQLAAEKLGLEYEKINLRQGDTDDLENGEARIVGTDRMISFADIASAANGPEDLKGEAGTIGSCPAVMNAVVDALAREYGIEHVDMPVTPARLWQAIQNR